MVVEFYILFLKNIILTTYQKNLATQIQTAIQNSCKQHAYDHKKLLKIMLMKM